MDLAALTHPAPHIILGIDPGTIVMGYGLIAVSKSNITLVDMGVLHLARNKDHAIRLQLIFARMEELLREHRPASVAIEAPFFGKNVQSMLKLGRAQGVAMAAAMHHGLMPVEYAPRKVKQSITGRGNASKEQVWEMLRHSLQLTGMPDYLDAADAVAVALCHHYQERSPVPAATQSKGGSRKSGGWASFAAQHPERVV